MSWLKSLTWQAVSVILGGLVFAGFLAWREPGTLSKFIAAPAFGLIAAALVSDLKKDKSAENAGESK